MDTIILSRGQCRVLEELSALSATTIEVEREYADDDDRSIRVWVNRYMAGAATYVVERSGDYQLG